MELKNFILQKIENYEFKTLKIRFFSKKLLERLKKEIPKYEIFLEKFLNKLNPIEEEKRGNFIFLVRILDFRLWEFEKNWQYKKEKGFFGLMERCKEIFEGVERINFKTFKENISPKEKESLARLRYFLLKESFKWLKEKQRNSFDNYFEKNKDPLKFCKNLFFLSKFRDFSENFYFLKPNQLLYFEYLVAKNLTKIFEKELNTLTIFPDYKISQLFLNFKLILPAKKFIEKIKTGKILKENSLFVKELRAASLILGEKIAQTLNIPSFKLDTILWGISHKIKFKIPYPKIKTIFY